MAGISGAEPDRLSSATLPALKAGVRRPGYDRAKLATGIVHLGLGNFHRAHQAVYTEEALDAGDLRWGIVGASLRHQDVRTALQPQDGLYTLVERGGEGTAPRVIGALRRAVVLTDERDALMAELCRPEVSIVTLTVTEKGYHWDPATRGLNEAAAEVRADLAAPETPSTPVGLLVLALGRRRAAGLKPFTVISCDNLPSNGRTLHALMKRYANLVSPDLGAYIEAEVKAPCTMVDRIVPATTDELRAAVAGATGLADAWPVPAEPFTQWVIENDFSGARPEWERGGATFVADVAPYEEMKLRLLNGSHSAIAYLGCLAGLKSTPETMDAPAMAALIPKLMDDLIPTLRLAPGMDPAAYKRALLKRFGNHALRHATRQIAQDGSQKLPQRILVPIRMLLKAGRGIERPALTIAAWMRYVTGVDEAGNRYAIDDPLAEEIGMKVARAGGGGEGVVYELLRLGAVFGDDLPGEPRFVGAVTEAFREISSKGALAAAKRYAGLP